MADLQSITLKNVELRWAHLAEPSTKGEYASNKYEVFVVMDKDTAKAVKELKNPSQDIKELDDGLYGLTLKTSVKPTVMNRSKEKLSDEAVKGIGNGTKAIVKANQYVGFKGKIYLGLQAVMVTDYKEYVSDPFDDIDIDDVASSDDDDLL
jgi:hypothetical protein|nr:MAG TPA: DNA helix destabilizing protein [Caudoviricetes sp.]